MPFLFLTTSCFLEIFTVSVPTGLQVLGAGTAVARLPDKATPGLRVSNRHPFEGRRREQAGTGGDRNGVHSPEAGSCLGGTTLFWEKGRMGEANGDGESAGGALASSAWTSSVWDAWEHSGGEAWAHASLLEVSCANRKC